jgi:Na+-driven multidrug efflux pump
MKKRYLYVLLFSVPAFLISIIISFLLFGASAGILWLYVFGDNPWPSSAENLLVAFFLTACTTLWIAFLSVAYIAGKKEEARTAFNTKHLVASVCATALLTLFVLSYQWSVGNIGSSSSNRLCSDYCRERGYASSGMPPKDAGEKNCTCFDAQGHAAEQIPIANITGQERQ